MAWNGGFGDEEEGKGLELSLGLPGYFSRSPSQAAGLEEKGSAGSAAASATAAKGSDGFKGRPVAAAPVVGWPPVRAFRRNLVSSSSKPSHEPSSHGGKDSGRAKVESGKKGLFVKINMDGVPIGRKVDLSAHGSYGTLSGAVDQLFRGLLAGREEQVTMGLLDGSGDYTLVYEDDEGDQMLVGDVPWDMFIATARRLRVLRSSDLNTSSLGPR
ncbi:auxin-responsive protein IAA16-like isoform X2 [Phragmites australis]|uniref:auxin-responsive protein IAA16-like isoform X2 n=1 Tax=Phragmites australis TaxID=29695 RepID=UPI002D78160D|nr:auxin-responsive protein IAA16-like isoform X2 [Phragmites australis]